MPAPEYLICLECETPCYVFECRGDEVVEATCETCGNDNVLEFLTEDDYEELTWE